ncbi:uncharacterized protein Z520_08820 [Fonsecaea multimorphosa CBS 102226]|uniref:Uncharacterized protein n=1 Tax=Fonsecaea multimorphosa CBS 102226 TaxID=1442371 RepID=A0A0D2KF27_9EURO|nr:uncharacterized protein Z520_08820 [Fonsecaea multimorphosa CBS 102226]KIX95303.1 hypothetical protein Z520_08820 [Fonsecaea multimorphosa CBS 102226]OAL21102.1 hypothetical protein AYO22_08259 [Fonsecaea multimorphosa]
MATAHKRRHSDVLDEPSKRAAGPSKPEISPELVLQHMSHGDLKEVVLTLLAHPTTGAVTGNQLLAYRDRAFEDARRNAKEERNNIICAADVSAGNAFRTALEHEAVQSIEIWPRSLQPQLPRIQALINRGTLVNGPTFAWDALKKVTQRSMYQWDGGDARVLHDEKVCDWFHDDIDGLMLQIFRIQQHHDPDWLRTKNPTRKIREWQNRAKTSEGPCTYRYQRTLAFLEALEAIDPQTVA